MWAGCSFQRSSGFSSIRVSGSRIEVSTDFRMANRSCHVRKYYRKTEMVYCSPGRKSLRINISKHVIRSRASTSCPCHLPSFNFWSGKFSISILLLADTLLPVDRYAISQDQARLHYRHVINKYADHTFELIQRSGIECSAVTLNTFSSNKHR